jgi:hypothetical protein
LRVQLAQFVVFFQADQLRVKQGFRDLLGAVVVDIFLKLLRGKEVM